ncbi:hypothetical protein QYE76_068650 [Lolium multiflorum]|uniref:Uncharacterized protein n=1 Tax=Lolium multiflorum TaxID=4521 RepID=A0AAD8SEV2_LOLMU|nr:hypothetical protein QYE76_068650 [Lolium multiflorum]
MPADRRHDRPAGQLYVGRSMVKQAAVRWPIDGTTGAVASAQAQKGLGASVLLRAGGTAFGNMAVGYNNVNVDTANMDGIAIGNTDGLTEMTAELGVSLPVAAGRRTVEVDQYMRAGLYNGWLLHM